MKAKRDYFIVRTQTSQHTEDLSVASSNDDDRALTELFSNVLGHHPLERKPNAKMHIVSHDQMLSTAKLAELLYNNYYSGVVIQRENKDKVSEIRFLEEVLSSNNSSSLVKDVGCLWPCKNSFLIGRVGIGKTSLFSYLVVKHAAAFENRFVPVRADLEVMAKRDLSPTLFYTKLLNLLFRAAVDGGVVREEDVGYNDIIPEDSYAIDENVKIDLYCGAIRRLARRVYDLSGRRFFIMVDNLDQYYYLFDRGGFCEEGDVSRSSACRKMSDLVMSFTSPQGALGNIGASVLFVMRKHTLDYVKASLYAVEGQIFPSPAAGVYRLKKVPLEDVVLSRRKLMEKAVDLMPARIRKELFGSSMGSLFDAFLESRGANINRQMINSLERLSSHGHRESINHLAGFKWGVCEKDLIDRFFTQFGPFLLSFMLGRKRRYSQRFSRFPNMFLVRGDAEYANDEFTPARLKAPHRQTYWLKYLIVALINSYASMDYAIRISDVIEIFTTKGYERHIVELVLGSLCQVDGAYMVEPNWIADGTNSCLAAGELKMTERGKAFFKLGDIFSFLYLQLVVEDNMLEIPKVCAKDYSYNWSDYNYMTHEQDSYNAGIRSMVLLKAKQVALFIEILESAYIAEKSRYPDVFRALGNQGVPDPNLTLIKNQIATWSSQVLAPGKEDNDGEIQQIFALAAKRRPEIDQHFEAAYLRANV